MNAFQGFPRITPFLWFDGNAEEAVQFYLTIFKNSRRIDELRTTEESPTHNRNILTIEFELEGQNTSFWESQRMTKETASLI